jgi:plasmid stabilization system protein ParE
MEFLTAFFVLAVGHSASICSSNRRVSPRADRDLDEYAQSIGRDNLAAAQAFEHLAAIPERKSRRAFHNPAVAGIRHRRSPGFKRHLIFYRLIPGRYRGHPRPLRCP